MTYTETFLWEKYEYISSFRCERAVAYSEKRERISIIDPAGRTVFAYRTHRDSSPGTVSHYGEYSEGLLSFLGENGKIGYIDTEGNTVLPPLYERASMFIDGLACVQTGGKRGLIDKNGDFVIPPTYDGIGANCFSSAFKENRIFVVRDGHGGFLDRAGNEVIPFDLDNPHGIITPAILPTFSEGLALVSRSGRGMYIDLHGKVVLTLPDECRIACDFIDGRTGIGFDSRGQSSYTRLMRRDGSWLLPPEYNAIGINWGNRLQHEKNGRRVFADGDGNIVFETDCNFVHDYFDGYTSTERTWAQKNGKWGVIDDHGNTVLPFAWDYFEIWSCGGGLFCVSDEKKHGCIDRDGNTEIPMEYDSDIHFWYGKHAIVKKNGQWAILKLEGKNI